MTARNPGLLVQAARDIADGLDAAALVAFTLSGNTVRRLARLRPPESTEDHARELAFPESTCSQK